MLKCAVREGKGKGGRERERETDTFHFNINFVGGAERGRGCMVSEIRRGVLSVLIKGRNTTAGHLVRFVYVI